MPRRAHRETAAQGSRGARRAGTVISRHPREFVGAIMASAAVVAVFANALFLQKGPHPAPIFAARPLLMEAAPPPLAQNVPSRLAPPNAPLNRVQLTAEIQRELTRRGFYEGTADGIWGAKTDAAARDFLQATGLKNNPEPSASLLQAIVASKAKANTRAVSTESARNDPIAELIAPSKLILAIQRALSDFGYGQIKPTGVYDPETRAAIEKFERDRRLPPTGQISERFVRELASMTGRPLE